MADFATVTELEEFMGTSGLGARGTALLGYASAQVRRYCGQDLEATTGRQEEFAANAGRRYLTVSQRPVTALTMTVDAVAFTDFVWDRWGRVHKDDWLAWDEGPIIITYDSGYAAGSDEMAGVKAITLEMCTRALGGPVVDTFGSEVGELRGGSVHLFLTEEEKRQLDDFVGLVTA